MNVRFGQFIAPSLASAASFTTAMPWFIIEFDELNDQTRLRAIMFSAYACSLWLAAIYVRVAMYFQEKRQS